jgi:hypothetical protein
MVARLVQRGDLTDASWCRIFRRVPRHIFVPAFFVPTDEGAAFRPVRQGDPGWLDAVYTNASLVTQLNSTLDPGSADGPVRGVPTSDHPASPTVEQAGDRRLWDELEATHANWSQLGRPPKAQLAVTVTPDRGTSISALTT